MGKLSRTFQLVVLAVGLAGTSAFFVNTASARSAKHTVMDAGKVRADTVSVYGCLWQSISSPLVLISLLFDSYMRLVKWIWAEKCETFSGTAADLPSPVML